MSEMVLMGLAGAFGLSLAAFVATSAAALPFLAYDEIRGRPRAPRRRA